MTARQRPRKINTSGAPCITTNSSSATRAPAEAYLKRMRRLKFSDKTVKAHRNALGRLVSFLAGKRFQDVTRDDLEAYHAGLVVEDLSSHTVELYLRVVRKFFADLDSRSLIFVNPAAGLVVGKPERKLRWTLSDAEVRRVLAVPDLSIPTGLRDRAMIELLYAAGLRIGELAGLRVDDVDIANQTIRVLGEGRKERVLPIGKHAVRHLRDYVKHGRPKLLKEGIDEPALWLSIKTQLVTGHARHTTIG